MMGLKSYRRTARRSGAVLLILIICMSLLMGLVFFVFNLGDQVNRRIESQNAADAIAISGSGWMARSMNIVAMSNVTIPRLISLACVMDTLPVAAEMTIAEMTNQRKLVEALDPYKDPTSPAGQGVDGGFTPYEKDNFYRLGMAEIWQELNEQAALTTQLELLQEIDDTFDQINEKNREGSYDVAQSTEWDGPDGRGWIWRAIVALDEFSRVTAETAPRLSQDDASRIGKANHMDVAFIVPIYPAFPARKGTFWDFGVVLESHLKYGRDRNTGIRIAEVESSNVLARLRNTKDTAQETRDIRVRGGAIPDYTDAHRLGPFSRLYRWRHYWDQYIHTNGAREFEERWGYTTYGPFERMLQTTTNGFGNAGWWWHSWHHWGGGDGILDLTRFMFHLCTISQIKLAYVLGLEGTVQAQYADEWITDYEEARRYVEGDKHNRAGSPTTNTGVMMTRYYRVHVKSTFDPTRPIEMETYADDDTFPAVTYPLNASGTWDQWMSPNAWQSNTPTHSSVPRRWFSWQLDGRGPYDNPQKQPLHRWVWDRKGWSPITDDTATPPNFSMTGTVEADGKPVQRHNLGSLRFKRTTSRTLKLLLEDPAADDPSTPDVVEPVEQPQILTVTLRATEDTDSETGIITLQRQPNGTDWLINANGSQAMLPDTSYSSLIDKNDTSYAVTLTGTKVYSPDTSAPYRVRFIVTFRKLKVDLKETMEVRVRPEKQLEPVDGATAPWGKWVSLDGSGNAWFKRSTRKTTHDSELGLPQIQIGVTEEGMPIFRKYRTFQYEWRIFGGIELRNEFPVSNLIEGGRGELPIPLLIDTAYGDYDPADPNGDEGLRREHYSFLGVARRNAHAPVWGQQFRSSNPSGFMTAVAQAELFNNKSWDLWTQDWQVRLVPVTRWAEWMNRFNNTMVDSGEIAEVVTQEELDKALRYLEAIDEAMVEVFLAH